MADTPAANSNTNDAALATQYQPGSDLGDTLRSEDTFLNAYNKPNVPAPVSTTPEAPSIGGPAPVAAPIEGAAPAKPPLHARIAEGIMHALGGSDGKPGDWAKAVLAGGLAGMGTAAREHARGFAAGLGEGAEGVMDKARQARQQAVENANKQKEIQQRQQQIDLEKQRTQSDVTNASERLKLAQAEDARRQAESIRDAAVFEKKVALMDQDIKKGDFEGMKNAAEYMDVQSSKWNALQKVGAQSLKIDGAASPEFDHLGDAENFATKNQDQIIGNHSLQIVRNPDSGKYAIMEVPQDKATMRDVVDAAGNHQQMLLTPAEYLDKQEQIAKTKHYMLTASKSSLELKEELEAYKEEGTVKFARKELTRVNGDYTKLSPGSREALLRDVNDRFSKAQAGLEKELQKPDELRDKDTVDTLTRLRNEYAGEAQKLWNDHPNNVGAPPAPKAAEKQNQQVLPDEQRKAVTLRLKNMQPDQQMAAINSSKLLSQADKDALIKDLGLTPAQAPAQQ